MADPVLAAKDPQVILAEALEAYRVATITAANPNGTTLAPADPRRIHLQTLLAIVSQDRGLIDFSGKQSLLRFVSDDWIDILAALWGLERLGPKPSRCTERFNFAASAARTIRAGVGVSDGTNKWTVLADTSNTGTFVDALVECAVAGGATNQIAPGQINQLVDSALVPGCTGVSNTTETQGGRDTEQLEDYRERLRDAPESTSTAGPGVAYEAIAVAASASVADAVALGPDDAGDMAGTAPTPGEVHILLLEGTRDDAGVLTSVVPEPGQGVLDAVSAACTPEDVRPLGDHVITKAPQFVDFDLVITYYIGASRSDSAADIEAAVDEAFAAYQLWQQSAIGRDVNPSEANRLICNAGAKRTAIASPSFTALKRDESARASYIQLVFGGVEDD